MKCIMVMYDSLNRHFLQPYGNDWVKTPNFQRLAERTVTFDQSWVCSMPCMPARRDLHTGRPNFLHRTWGPLEPFDDSVPSILKNNGVSSHLFSDHYHYWEDGGCTYHTKYTTWEFFRGHEGDPWKGCVDLPGPSEEPRLHRQMTWHSERQDLANRMFMRREQDQPQPNTFDAGIDFIRRNRDADNWFCQIETFDPHEPFFTQRKYKDRYEEHYRNYRGRLGDWPHYGKTSDETPGEIEHLRCEYAALVSMCDEHLGQVLDVMDELDLWEDTMLIVWTDHGFMLGEHDWWGKCRMGWYNETAHTPLFMWDPRPGKEGKDLAGQRRSALVQPAIDLGPTLLEYFGIDRTPDMLGRVLRDTIEKDTPVREAAIFGQAGSQVNVVDGRYHYARGPQNPDVPWYDHTLMPTRMRGPFSVDELRDRTVLREPFSFTKGCCVMKIGGPSEPGDWLTSEASQTVLWDLETDPGQTAPCEDADAEQRMIDHMTRLMREADAPAEVYDRLGLGEHATV